MTIKNFSTILHNNWRVTLDFTSPITGEIVQPSVIFGANGSGKTMLLHHIVQADDDGRAYLFSANRDPLTMNAYIDHAMNFIIEKHSYHWYPHVIKEHQDTIHLEGADSNDLIPFLRWGAGHQQLMFLLVETLRRVMEGYNLILIDEIERSLHPQLQNSLLAGLRFITEENGAQVICTSHSMNILDNIFSRQTFCLSNDPQQGSWGSGVEYERAEV